MRGKYGPMSNQIRQAYFIYPLSLKEPPVLPEAG